MFYASFLQINLVFRSLIRNFAEKNKNIDFGNIRYGNTNPHSISL